MCVAGKTERKKDRGEERKEESLMNHRRIQYVTACGNEEQTEVCVQVFELEKRKRDEAYKNFSL